MISKELKTEILTIFTLAGLILTGAIVFLHKETVTEKCIHECKKLIKSKETLWETLEEKCKNICENKEEL